MLLALDLKALEDLVDAQIEHAVELIEEEVDVFVGKDRETGEVDRGEAQIASAVGNLAGRIVAVADDAGTAAHVSYLGLGTAFFIVGEVVGRVDESVVGEEALCRYAEGELEQIVVGILGIVVDALLEVGGEIIGISEGHIVIGLGVVERMALAITEVVFLQVDGLEITVFVVSGVYNGVPVGQWLTVQCHGEVVDIRMLAILVDFGIVGIVGRTGLETHFHGLGFTVVHELILYIY